LGGAEGDVSTGGMQNSQVGEIRDPDVNGRVNAPALRCGIKDGLGSTPAVWVALPRTAGIGATSPSAPVSRRTGIPPG